MAAGAVPGRPGGGTWNSVSTSPSATATPSWRCTARSTCTPRPDFRERLIELVSEGKHQIVVDLEGVDFLDSTGLGVLVGGLKRLRSHDGDLSLVCTQPRILKVFEITGSDQGVRRSTTPSTTPLSPHEPAADGRGGRRARDPGARRVRRAGPAGRLVAWRHPSAVLADERIDDLKLAVSEACTNAIEAHGAVDTDDRVVVRCLDGRRPPRGRSSRTGARASIPRPFPSTRRSPIPSA